MKKMILSTVSLILAIALCACGNANDPNKDLSEENQLASYCIVEHKYTCDEYGNIIKVDIQCGPTYDLIDEEVEEPIKPHRTYNLIHGDYCIYNAD